MDKAMLQIASIFARKMNKSSFVEKIERLLLRQPLFNFCQMSKCLSRLCDKTFMINDALNFQISYGIYFLMCFFQAYRQFTTGRKTFAPIYGRGNRLGWHKID